MATKVRSVFEKILIRSGVIAPNVKFFSVLGPIYAKVRRSYLLPEKWSDLDEIDMEASLEHEEQITTVEFSKNEFRRRAQGLNIIFDKFFVLGAKAISYEAIHSSSL